MTSAANPMLNRLGDLMKTDAFRQAFVDGADDAMLSNGVIKANIPPKILAALESCGIDELAFLAKVGQAFWDVSKSSTPADGSADAASAMRMV